MSTQEYIVDNAVWVDKVRQIVPSDRVLGGNGEPANWQAEDLANRTKWLKARYDEHTKKFVTVESNITKAQTTADQAKTAAATADGKAVKAQTTADQAKTAAATADGKAVKAQTTADQAKTAASTADGKAVKAQTTADQAKTAASTADGKAVKAQQTADSAVSAASTADSKAATAQTTANQAKTAASTADGKAVKAQTTADQAKTAASTADGKAVKAQQTADSAVSAASTADSKAATAQTTANQVKEEAYEAKQIGEKAQISADKAMVEVNKKIDIGQAGLAGNIKITSGDGIPLGELVNYKSGFYANNAYNTGYERSYGVYLKHQLQYESWLSWTYTASNIYLEATTPAGKFKTELLSDKNTTTSPKGFLRASGSLEAVTTNELAVAMSKSKTQAVTPFLLDAELTKRAQQDTRKRVDVTKDRVKDVEYTNTTDMPIEIDINVELTGINFESRFTFYVNGKPEKLNYLMSGSPMNYSTTQKYTKTVLPGEKYKYETTGGAKILVYEEFRK